MIVNEPTRYQRTNDIEVNNYMLPYTWQSLQQQRVKLKPHSRLNKLKNDKCKTIKKKKIPNGQINVKNNGRKNKHDVMQKTTYTELQAPKVGLEHT